ncbi:MAG TPA: exodeoxyribonuclease VII small subunit [Xanthomonadales bacterium]|nr:exodeoxyribonuclease VII small subunit [Xanthomonadales bacterium]
MSKTKDQKPDFEKSLTELEGLVSRLESGELSLDQSLECFKRGVELTRHCQAVLDEAQQMVELLASPDAAADTSDTDESV